MDKLESAAQPSPRLDIQIRHRVGTLNIDVSFELRQPWTVLFGPSGSGKSTILRAIAGLVRANSAQVVWTLRDRSEGSAAASTVVHLGLNKSTPPHTRRIPLAPQAACLFPHRTVLENVTYSCTDPAHDFRSRIATTLSLFRIEHVAHKLPAELSGGEAQRVNLARAAFAAENYGVLLLDEPFTGLDFALRSKLMQELRVWANQKNLCVLSVTHDVAEAFQLGAEVVKLADGRVVDQGPVERVLAEERARLLAELNPNWGLGC